MEYIVFDSISILNIPNKNFRSLIRFSISVSSTVADSRGRSDFAYPGYQKRVTRSATLHLYNFDRSFRVSIPRREGKRRDSKTAAIHAWLLNTLLQRLPLKFLSMIRVLMPGNVYGMQTVRWKRRSSWKKL